MRSTALLLLVANVVSGFVVPIRLTAVNTTQNSEFPEVATLMHNVWTTTVVIGNPGQVFNVAIDTMSSFLFIPDKTCTSGGCAGKNVYDSSKSSTYHHAGASFHETTLYGTVQGSIGNDTVVLGEHMPASGVSVLVAGATFGQATVIPGSLPNGIDGILGLALLPLSPRGTTPVFETAIKNHAVSNGTFTIWLEDQWATDDNGTEGVIYYGNIDPLHCILNQRHMYPLTNAELFQFTTPSVSVGANYKYNQRTQTIVDSTSPFIAAPNAFIQNVLSQIGLPRSTQLPAVVPCDLQIDIAFNFAQGTEHINQLNLVYKEADGTCILALIESPISQKGNIQFFELGHPFLRGRCTYFDVAGQKVGFGPPITHGPHFPPTTAIPVTMMG